MDVKGIGVTLPMEMSLIVNTVLGFLVKIVYLARILKVQQKIHVNQRRTKMTEQEKYLEGHKNCGIKVGDRVRVTRKAEGYENGWADYWVDDMDNKINKILHVIEDSGKYGFACQETLEEDDFYRVYPYFVLEKI